VKVKRQVRHGAFVYIDEGQALTELTRRSGSTLSPTLRSIFTHGPIGNTNASLERRRIVPGELYVYGIVLALQEALAGPLLDDAEAGTPQRFSWVRATDPQMPTDPPAWPGPLGWRPPDAGVLDPRRTMRGGYARHPIGVPDDVTTEIRDHHIALQRQKLALSPLEAHRMLRQFKNAALLAVLDGRLDINGEDWRLAALLSATSQAVLHDIHQILASQAAERAVLATKRAVQREAALVEARSITSDQLTEAKIDRLARTMALHVHDHGEQTRKDFIRRHRRDRELLDEALASAVAQDWLEFILEPGSGEARKLYRPGRSRPA
jgi:hypothetical protein